MAKSNLKLKAQELRKRGESIGDIATILGASRSSVSTWCSDIVLSRKQQELLNRKMRIGNYKGRLIGAAIQKQKKLDKIDFYKKEAKEEISEISRRDILMSFLGLYLGEGAKSGNCFQFVNSNPDIIKFCINALEQIFNIPRSRIYCNVLINELYRDGQSRIENKWSEITKIPTAQFRKTIVIKSKNRKLYNNSDYLGTFMIRVSKSSNLQYKISGLMYELLKSLNLDLH